MTVFLVSSLKQRTFLKSKEKVSGTRAVPLTKTNTVSPDAKVESLTTVGNDSSCESANNAQVKRLALFSES